MIMYDYIQLLWDKDKRNETLATTAGYRQNKVHYFMILHSAQTCLKLSVQYIIEKLISRSPLIVLESVSTQNVLQI